MHITAEAIIKRKRKSWSYSCQKPLKFLVKLSISSVAIIMRPHSWLIRTILPSRAHLPADARSDVLALFHKLFHKAILGLGLAVWCWCVRMCACVCTCVPVRVPVRVRESVSPAANSAGHYLCCSFLLSSPCEQLKEQPAVGQLPIQRSFLRRDGFLEANIGTC